MRLTLRNLLRFLDQSELRSMERARLEQLVDESEKAEVLIKRIDSLRKNSAAAVPELVQADFQLNEVTSYLDGTMSEETISEFEKSLLVSDVRLAEVASCHEIRESLSSQSNPSVPLLLRQSIYDLGREVNYDLATRAEEASQADLDSSSPEADNLDEAGEQEVAQMVATMEDLPYVDAGPDQPEPIGGLAPEPEEAEDDDHEVVSLKQLKDKASRQSSTRLIGLIAGALALIAATFALGWYAGRAPSKLAANSNLPEASGEVDDADDSEPGGMDGEEKVVGSGPPELGSKTGDDSSAGEGDGKAPEENNGVDPNNEGVESALAMDMHPLPAVPELEVPEDPDALPVPPSLVDFSIGDKAELETPAAPVLLSVATVSTTGRVPFTLAADGQWLSAAAGKSLTEDTRIHVLAGDRIDLDFGGNVQVTLVGPTRAQLGRRDIASQTDVLIVDYGEVILVSKVADVDFWLQRGKRQYQLSFPEQGTTFESQFTRYREPGSDPRSEPMAEIDRFDVTSGRALVKQTVKQIQNEYELLAGQGIALSESENESLSRPFVKGSLSPKPPLLRFRENLSGVLEDNPKALSLKPDENLVSYLIDIKGERRQEFRFGSMVWLSSLGNYDFLVDYLNESSNRGNWRSIMQALRRSLETDPDNAGRLYQALSVVGAEEQAAMYAAILGMKPDELEAGGDERMVEWLRSDEMSVRVLAIESIRSITEGPDLGYKAHAETKVRRRSVDRQWSKVLKKKELRFPQPPEMPFPTVSEPKLNTEPDPSAIEDAGSETDMEVDSTTVRPD